MISRESLIKNVEEIELSQPITRDELESSELSHKIKKTFGLVEFLMISNGSLINDYIKLYSARDMIERNTTYGVDEELPDWLMIGDDSGSQFYFLKADNSGDPAVYAMGSGAFIESNAEKIAESIAEWASRGFYLPEEPSYPEYVHIYLRRPPKNKLKSLLKIKKYLVLDMALKDLKACLDNTPSLLASKVPYVKGTLGVALYSLAEEDDCLSVYSLEDPSKPLSLDQETIDHAKRILSR
jgi:hypothetical protein